MRKTLGALVADPRRRRLAQIAFSRADIYALKHMIEEVTPHKCCVVYGALPPDTRTQQARLFNGENTGYDVLIASDAVGMGLNLNIRRIVLSSVRKFDGALRRRRRPREGDEARRRSRGRPHRPRRRALLQGAK